MVFKNNFFLSGKVEEFFFNNNGVKRKGKRKGKVCYNLGRKSRKGTQGTMSQSTP